MNWEPDERFPDGVVWLLLDGTRLVATVGPYARQRVVDGPDEIVEAVVAFFEPREGEIPLDEEADALVAMYAVKGNLADGRQAAERLLAIRAGEADPATPPLNVRRLGR